MECRLYKYNRTNQHLIWSIIGLLPRPIPTYYTHGPITARTVCAGFAISNKKLKICTTARAKVLQNGPKCPQYLSGDEWWGERSLVCPLLSPTTPLPCGRSVKMLARCVSYIHICIKIEVKNTTCLFLFCHVLQHQQEVR